MWLGLKLAYEQLFPTLPDASGRRKVVIVVSDGLPTKSGSGGQFNRPAYLSLSLAMTLKSHGTLVMGIGFGSKHTGHVGTSGCAPLACAGGGVQMFLGTDQALGTVYFSSVDKSTLYCTSDGGCNVLGSATMDALVSGISQEERLGNTLDLSSSGHDDGRINEWLDNVRHPHRVVLKYDQHSCGAWQAKNLGTGHSTPQECASAAVQDPACPKPAAIMFSDAYNYAWGCRCCLVDYPARPRPTTFGTCTRSSSRMPSPRRHRRLGHPSPRASASGLHPCSPRPNWCSRSTQEWRCVHVARARARSPYALRSPPPFRPRPPS